MIVTIGFCDYACTSAQAAALFKALQPLRRVERDGYLVYRLARDHAEAFEGMRMATVLPAAAPGQPAPLLRIAHQPLALPPGEEG